MEDNPVTGIAMCIPQLEPKPIDCPEARATFRRIGELFLAKAEIVLFGDVVVDCERYTAGQFPDAFDDELTEKLNLILSYMRKRNPELSTVCGAQIPEAKEITLTSLCGFHKLSGVGRRRKQCDEYAWCTSVNQFLFTLDGVTYVATEDENDGYRSCMAKLEILDAKPATMFDPIDVVCHMQKDDSSDILEMIDIRNGKTVLLVGTNYYDSYYPCFINEWIPENLAVNGDKEE